MSQASNDFRKWTIGGLVAAFAYFVLDKGADAVISNYVTKEVTDGIGTNAVTLITSSSVPNWFVFVLTLAVAGLCLFLWRRSSKAIAQLDKLKAESTGGSAHLLIAKATIDDLRKSNEVLSRQSDMEKAAIKDMANARQAALVEIDTLNKQLHSQSQEIDSLKSQLESTINEKQQVTRLQLEAVKRLEGRAGELESALSQAKEEVEALRALEKRLMAQVSDASNESGNWLQPLETTARLLDPLEIQILKELHYRKSNGLPSNRNTLSRALHMNNSSLEFLLQRLESYGATAKIKTSSGAGMWALTDIGSRLLAIRSY